MATLRNKWHQLLLVFRLVDESDRAALNVLFAVLVFVCVCVAMSCGPLQHRLVFVCVILVYIPPIHSEAGDIDLEQRYLLGAIVDDI